MNEILTMILAEFPIRKINVDLPSWITCLSRNDQLKQEIYSWIFQFASKYKVMRHLPLLCDDLSKNEYIEQAEICSERFGSGEATIRLSLPDCLFYNMISSILGHQIINDGDLLIELKTLQKSTDLSI